MSVGFKLGAFSDDLASDFAVAAQLGAQAGLDGLAVRYVGGRNIKDLDADEVRLIKRQADEHGLEISAVGSPYGRDFYLDDDNAQRDAERLLAKMIRDAEILDTELIRVFTLWLPGQEPLPEWRRRPAYPDCLDQLVDRLTPSVRMAERAGVTLMLELEGASYVGQVGEARALMERLDSRAVALCWDVCNGWWSGENPWPDGYAHAQQVRIVDVQFKDVPADPADPSRPMFDRVVVGQGDVPYRQIVPALIKSGYDGYFTVERVYHPMKPEEHPQLQRDALADIENLKAIVADAEGDR
jgi:sugar phosphate isomerase/epimerase